MHTRQELYFRVLAVTQDAGLLEGELTKQGQGELVRVRAKDDMFKLCTHELMCPMGQIL